MIVCSKDSHVGSVTTDFYNATQQLDKKVVFDISGCHLKSTLARIVGKDLPADRNIMIHTIYLHGLRASSRGLLVSSTLHNLPNK